jgi:ATP-dependent Zn protease
LLRLERGSLTLTPQLPVHKATIIQRGHALGIVMQLRERD